MPYRIFPGSFFRQSLLFLWLLFPAKVPIGHRCSRRLLLKNLSPPSAATSWCAVTRWTNARHTCLLITTYFQFSNCQAQYSGTSFPGSGIAEVTQNRLPDIYHTAHSAGHIYHVPALLIHLGERYTVVSAVRQRFQTSSGRRSGRVCLISRFIHFFLLHSGPNFFFSSNCSINQILSLYLPQELMYWSGLNPLERNWLPLFFFSPLLSLRTLLNQRHAFFFFLMEGDFGSYSVLHSFAMQEVVYFIINTKDVFCTQWGDVSGLTQAWILFESFITCRTGALVGGLECIWLFFHSDVWENLLLSWCLSVFPIYLFPSRLKYVHFYKDNSS